MRTFFTGAKPWLAEAAAYFLDCQATNANAMTAATIAESGTTGPVRGAATSSAKPPTASTVASAMTVLAHVDNRVRSILRRPSESICRSYFEVDAYPLPDRAALDASILVPGVGLEVSLSTYG